ncbi:MAG: hypothetical protein J5I93_20840, partial [Pirellulaceae bacterium]|nr:hypothetical protein [Pirellulaceae bacterium]
MSETVSTHEMPTVAEAASGGLPARGFPLLDHLVEQLSRRLADFISTALSGDDPLAADSCAFLLSQVQATAAGLPGGRSTGAGLAEAAEPLERLRSAFQLDDIELQLLVLAGLPEQHEGYAQIFRSLHPESRPRPTLALAAQLLGNDPPRRVELRRKLESGPLHTAGLVAAPGPEPFFLRNLTLADTLWPVLRGIDAWPERLRGERPAVALAGLDRWLRGAGAAAVTAIRDDALCTIVVGDEDPRRAIHRGLALVASAGRNGLGFQLPAADRETVALLQVHCVARNVVPVISFKTAEGGASAALPDLSQWPGPAVVCVRSGAVELPSR